MGAVLGAHLCSAAPGPLLAVSRASSGCVQLGGLAGRAGSARGTRLAGCTDAELQAAELSKGFSTAS